MTRSEIKRSETKSCQEWRHHLVEAVCDELTSGRREALEEHLETCPGCASELAGLRRAVRVVDEALPPRPADSELDLWRRILPEIEALEEQATADASRPERRLVIGYPVAAFLAAALLAMGLALGLLAPKDEVVPILESPGSVQLASHGLDAEYARYLERATPLLLAIANRQIQGIDVASFDPETEQRLAEGLASEAENLAGRLDGEGRGRQAGLTLELGRVFLQMANLPRGEYQRGLQVVQATIEKRSLLFQLSVEEMRHL